MMPGMTKWEYGRVTYRPDAGWVLNYATGAQSDLIKHLNVIGVQGWEVVCLLNLDPESLNSFLVKRPLAE
jgi:hypothetical protein